MTLSIWPHDTAREPDQPLKQFGHLTCFVVSPFQPKERFDDLLSLVGRVCEHLRATFQLDQFECVRSDTIASAGVIHPEIWQHLKRADVIVADVSGMNGNVLLELGVASAWRRKEQVIILREETMEEKHLFDINPARHIEYSRTSVGFQSLERKLGEAMVEAIAASPFAGAESVNVDLPLRAMLDDGKDCDALWCPEVLHRRLLPDCLEFGSLYSFARSWLAIAGLKPKRVKVRAEIRFTERREVEHRCWVGINLRAQLFYANLGHLVILRSDGTVARTARDEALTSHHDVELGRIEGYDPSRFVAFEISMDDSAWDIRVGSVHTSVPLRDMGYVFTAGRILIQTYFSRVGIRHLEVDSL